MWKYREHAQRRNGSPPFLLISLSSDTNLICIHQYFSKFINILTYIVFSLIKIELFQNIFHILFLSFNSMSWTPFQGSLYHFFSNCLLVRSMDSQFILCSLIDIEIVSYFLPFNQYWKGIFIIISLSICKIKFLEAGL